MPEMNMADAIRALLKREAEPVIRDGVLVGLVMADKTPTGRVLEEGEDEGAQQPCPPNESQWYLTVTFTPQGGDTDYNYDYYRDEPGDAEIASLVPVGAKLVESKIRRTPGHPDGPDIEDME